mmetsp:Transcript_45942/g.72613  ORF Transcript_45942/g.72613 Transcript_45942/m.72613 type:complete len:120 (-) Transcript_45942:112-471(-)
MLRRPLISYLAAVVRASPLRRRIEAEVETIGAEVAKAGVKLEKTAIAVAVGRKEKKSQLRVVGTAVADLEKVLRRGREVGASDLPAGPRRLRGQEVGGDGPRAVPRRHRGRLPIQCPMW